ncbi:hypothetical protein TUMEXPCC7403_07415 [Tumidithrix helvetica PCC 7403]|uniref:hypothetical protein n=1 Tax=Tumidithrix helvetica TaxID=3457545 RepID=UPI003C8EBFC9
MRFYTFGNNLNQGNNNFSGLRFWLTTLFIVWLLSSLGLGWLVNSVFVLIGFVTIAPVIVILGVQWWVRRSIVTADCPVCGATAVAAKNSQFQCLNCGEPLQEQNKQFVRLTPPGTIDIDVQVVE